MSHCPGTRLLSSYGGACEVLGAGFPAIVFCAMVNPLKYGSFGKYGIVTAVV